MAPVDGPSTDDLARQPLFIGGEAMGDDQLWGNSAVFGGSSAAISASSSNAASDVGWQSVLVGDPVGYDGSSVRSGELSGFARGDSAAGSARNARFALADFRVAAMRAS